MLPWRKFYHESFHCGNRNPEVPCDARQSERSPYNLITGAFTRLAFSHHVTGHRSQVTCHTSLRRIADILSVAFLRHVIMLRVP
jgi:hypothetical protein